ncbi:MAG: hypothetical protein ACK5OX_18180 [Desertimonas sp.]
MTWTDVGAPGDPVIGNLELFRRTTRQWDVAEDDTRQINVVFDRIVRGCQSTGLTGEAADAFRSIVDEADHALKDLPKVCGDVRWILADHARRLAEMYEASRQALARARAAWNDRQHAQRREHDASTRRAVLQRQLNYLNTLEPEQAAPHLPRVTSEYNAVTRSLNAACATKEAAQRRLDRETEERWTTLAERERCLNQQTATRLDGVDLRSLRDPGWLERLASPVGGFVLEFGRDLGGLALALITGDMNQVLWRLRDVLDSAALILDGLSLVLLAGAGLMALAGMVFPPFAVAAGALFTASWVVGVASAALAVRKAALSRMLYGSGSQDRLTGERLGLGDVTVDGAMAALAAIPVLGRVARPASVLARLGKVAEPVGTALDGAEIVTSTANPGAGWRASHLADGGPSWWSGTRAKEPRVHTIDRQLDLMRSGQRGLTSGCNVVMRPTVSSGGGGW